MDHVVVPLDESHIAAVSSLARRVAEIAGVEVVPTPARSHVTLLGYEGLDHATAIRSLQRVADVTSPFRIRGRGLGLFTGPQSTEITLFVPVVRTRELDALHTALFEALSGAGADCATWTCPGHWLPHITLLDRRLDPVALGRAAEWLAPRHHPSWEIPVDRLALTGGWAERDEPAATVVLGGR